MVGGYGIACTKHTYSYGDSLLQGPVFQDVVMCSSFFAFGRFIGIDTE